MPIVPQSEIRVNILAVHFKETDEKFRNREKGFLAKGVSAGSSVLPKETKKCIRMLGPAVHVAPGAPQPREAYIPAKTPF